MSRDECAYGCNHPLWGGSGRCFTGQDDDDIEYECSCGDGYISEDSLGRPSCVSKLALTGIYASIGLFSGLAFMFFLWKARDHRLLPQQAKDTRRAKLRRRLIALTSFYSGSAWIVFTIAAVRAEKAPLYASGMLQALYTTSIPAVIMAAANISEIWVETLPTQIMPLDSVTAKWKRVVEERNVLCWAGLAGMLCCIPFGISTCCVLDILTYVRAVNFATGLSAILAIVCFTVVATSLTRVINSMRHTREPCDRDFYYRALKTMWAQLLALSITAAIWTMGLAILELAKVGRGTPIVFIAIMVADANVGFCLAVHFCKVNVS